MLPVTATPQERVLISRLEQGDDEALKEAIATYGAVVFGMAAVVVKDMGVAEEIAQDTFLAIWMKPGAFDPEKGSLRAFLLRIARYKAIDRVRQQEARRERERATALDRSNDAEEKPDTLMVEEKDRVEAALDQLTEVQRQIVVLTFFGGRTCREAAEELGIPEGTAKTRLRNALIKLRRLQGEI
jgi:RNA polymerase sigma-70 factor (ECF subfamily)